jgi:hypothetical protein
LERVNALPDLGMAKTQRKLRDAIPSVDELSSAVSRVNVAPWEDPFALALGQAAPIEEEGESFRSNDDIDDRCNVRYGTYESRSTC